MSLRAIIGARVSVYDDLGQTSPTTQLDAGRTWASANGWTVIATFEDLDVSASVEPENRPGLGPFLTDRSHEWDVIIFSKVDRAFRSVFDAADVARWAERNKKIIVFAGDSIVLNFRDEEAGFGTDMAKSFLMMASMFAEIELKRIKTRFKDAHTYLKTTSRWATGKPPFGYMIVNHPEGKGKALAIDPVSSEYVRTMAAFVIDGKSILETADIMMSLGIPSPNVYRQTAHGGKFKTAPENKWSFSSVQQILRNPACLGYKTTKGNGGARHKYTIVRSGDGMPIQMADPIFTDEEWVLLQAKMDERSVEPTRTRSASPLQGIAYCGGCGNRMHKHSTIVKGVPYIYMRCHAAPGKPACPKHNFREDGLLEILDRMVPAELADRVRTEKIFLPGEDHTRERDRARKHLRDLREEKDNDAYDYPGGEEDYQERWTSLVAKLKRYEGLPDTEDRWEIREMDETYAQAYERMNRDQRRLMLISGNVKLICKPGDIHLDTTGLTDDILSSVVA